MGPLLPNLQSGVIKLLAMPSKRPTEMSGIDNLKSPDGGLDPRFCAIRQASRRQLQSRCGLQ